MPSFLLTVNSVEKNVRLESLSVQHTVNAPDVLEAVIIDESGVDVPALDAVVELVQTDVSPTVVYFAGLIQTANSDTMTGEGSARNRRITAFDYSVYTTFITVELTTSSGSPGDTVASFIAALVAEYLTDYGVTVHPSQATGPTLDPNTFEGATAQAALNAISEQTGWVWKIDALKQLRMWDPATEAAGFNVTATNDTYIEDIRSETQRSEHYANRVFVEGGNGYWQNISGETHFGDGSAITFEMNAPMFYFEVDYTSTLGIMVGLMLFVHRTGGTTTEYANDQLDAQWTFERGPSYALRQVSGAVLGPTEYIEIPGYSAMWPMRLVADGRGSPPVPARDLIIRRPWMFNRQAIQALADQLLIASQGDYERVTYPTDRVDILPGETQTIVVAEAGVNDTYTAVSVRLAYVSGGDTSAFRREVQAVNAVTARSFWLDLYSRWLQDDFGGSSSISTTVIGSTVLPTGPAPPLNSVQFNRTSQFGGDAAFTYNETTNSVVCGSLSDITAFSVESCQVFGYDNHIADP